MKKILLLSLISLVGFAQASQAPVSRPLLNTSEQTTPRNQSSYLQVPPSVKTGFQEWKRDNRP